MWREKYGMLWLELTRRPLARDRQRLGQNSSSLREKVMKQLLLRLWRDDQGQDLVEYALIVAAVGLALITTVNQLSTAVVSLYSSITQGLTSIGASGQ